MVDPLTRLQDLDSRHGELLDRLAELDGRINDVLSEWSRAKDAFHEEQQKRNVIFDREMETVERMNESEAA